MEKGIEYDTGHRRLLPMTDVLARVAQFRLSSDSCVLSPMLWVQIYVKKAFLLGNSLLLETIVFKLMSLIGATISEFCETAPLGISTYIFSRNNFVMFLTSLCVCVCV